MMRIEVSFWLCGYNRAKVASYDIGGGCVRLKGFLLFRYGRVNRADKRGF